MSNAIGLGGIEQILIEELNNIYFPNGMPLIPEDKQVGVITRAQKNVQKKEVGRSERSIICDYRSNNQSRNCLLDLLCSLLFALVVKNYMQFH